MEIFMRNLFLVLVSGIYCQLFFETIVPKRNWKHSWVAYTVIPAFAASRMVIAVGSLWSVRSRSHSNSSLFFAASSSDCLDCCYRTDLLSAFCQKKLVFISPVLCDILDCLNRPFVCCLFTSRFGISKKY